MKIRLVIVGKTTQTFVADGIREYSSRIRKYVPFEEVAIPALKNAKNLTPEDYKKKEGQLILRKTGERSINILLDENGKTFSSVGFANFLQQQMNTGNKTINFIVGGAYGFSAEVYKMADAKLSLSKMTYSHQLIRLIFLEQLYRAFTIIRNEPYHNQ